MHPLDLPPHRPVATSTSGPCCPRPQGQRAPVRREAHGPMPREAPLDRPPHRPRRHVTSEAVLSADPRDACAVGAKPHQMAGSAPPRSSAARPVAIDERGSCLSTPETACARPAKHTEQIQFECTPRSPPPPVARRRAGSRRTRPRQRAPSGTKHTERSPECTPSIFRRTAPVATRRARPSCHRPLASVRPSGGSTRTDGAGAPSIFPHRPRRHIDERGRVPRRGRRAIGRSALERWRPGTADLAHGPINAGGRAARRLASSVRRPRGCRAVRRHPPRSVDNQPPPHPPAPPPPRRGGAAHVATCRSTLVHVLEYCS